MTLYYGKCGCGWLVTDYPFMSCEVCGYIGCGSKDQIEHARNQGYLIKWQTEKPDNVVIRDCTLPDRS